MILYFQFVQFIKYSFSRKHSIEVFATNWVNPKSYRKYSKLLFLESLN